MMLNLSSDSAIALSVLTVTDTQAVLTVTDTQVTLSLSLTVTVSVLTSVTDTQAVLTVTDTQVTLTLSLTVTVPDPDQVPDGTPEWRPTSRAGRSARKHCRGRESCGRMARATRRADLEPSVDRAFFETYVAARMGLVARCALRVPGLGMRLATPIQPASCAGLLASRRSFHRAPALREQATPRSEKVERLTTEIASLTLLEAAELTESLKVRARAPADRVAGERAVR